MKRRTTILILTIATITCWGQTKEEKEREQADYIKLVWDSNMPDDLFDFYNKESIRATYDINKNLNPFYLRGDFDGDKKIDYALSVIESKTNKKGILIYHPGTKKYFLAGAGKSIANGHGDNYFWMDAWKVSDQREVEQGVGEKERIKLKGDAILVQKLESSSGLVYWDGKEYKWYQQGD